MKLVVQWVVCSRVECANVKPQQNNHGKVVHDLSKMAFDVGSWNVRKIMALLLVWNVLTLWRNENVVNAWFVHTREDWRKRKCMFLQLCHVLLSCVVASLALATRLVLHWP